ncbi:hypothetical protein L6452_17787 [Arctium lappa]|uniref:Uncharacterized protein n=1 Tax=Arctium lappa TaxID=4217 RepID=A0ACB9C476_ARCLA|nr:hypothetical protein L6452_17787 [Arctium lappa]
MCRPGYNKKMKKRRCMKARIDQKSHGSNAATPAVVMVPEVGFSFDLGPRFTLGEFQKSPYVSPSISTSISPMNVDLERERVGTADDGGR